MQAQTDLQSKLSSTRVVSYLGRHEHLPVKAHLGSKELRPEMLAMDGQS